MYKNQRVITLILARGGSKGLPGKNIKKMAGKPLIAHSIDAAKKSILIDKIVVSTDSKEIADIARKYGAEAPFLRPCELADDSSPSIDSVFHALNWYEKKDELFDVIVLLEPTSPIRDAENIDEGIRLLIDKKTANALVSVAKHESTHPAFNVIINKTGFIRRENSNVGFGHIRRQDLSKDIYFFDGSFYMSKVNNLKKEKSFYHKKTLAFPLDKYKSYEVDDISDFILIEALLKAKIKGQL